MANIRVWGILGGHNVGKSTTIGHLAGDFGKGPGGVKRGPGGNRQVLLRGGGYLTVFAHRRSRQEARQDVEKVISDTEDRAQRLAAANHGVRPQWFNLLVALRTDRYRNFPPAHTYLSQFVQQGWQLESLVLLSPDARDEALYHRFGVPVCYVYDLRVIGIGPMVGQVRNHFGWA